MKTKQDIKEEFIKLVELNPNVHGDGLYQLVKEFVETYSICPNTMEEVLADIVKNGVRLADGRAFIPYETQQVTPNTEWQNKVYAQARFHINPLVCPKV